MSDIPARASGRVQVANGRTVIELASGQATVRGLQARLARASRVEIAGGTTTLDKVAIDVGGGNAVVSGTAGSALNLNATLSAVPASVANNFAPGLDAAGTISGTAKVTGAAANPAVGYSIDWRGAQTAQTRSAGLRRRCSVSSSGDFAGGRLTFQANVGDGSGLGLRGGGTVDTGSRALSLDFSGGVPFSFLDAAAGGVGPVAHRQRRTSISRCAAPTSSPAIGGSLSTSGARFVAAASGIAINDIRAEIAMANGVGDHPHADRNAVDRRQHFRVGHGRHRCRQRFSGRHKAEDQRRPLYGRPRRHHDDERRPRDQGAAGVEADALRHGESREDSHHRAGPAAGLARRARRQAQERVGRGEGAGSRRWRRRPRPAAVRAR